MSSQDSSQPSGPPYASPNAAVGGLPSTSVDAPITSVFLVLYIIGAVAHMTIFQLNRRHGHKFVISGATFGFCMARITTCTMRLVWSTHQDNVSVAIAANIFVNAGVIILIIINLIFAQRVLRASHPKLGWHRVVHFLFLAYYIVIILLLAALITVIIQQSYTLDGNIHRIDRDVQLVGATNSAFAAFLPLPLLIIGVLLPRLRSSPSSPRTVDKFGAGRFRTKIRILIGASLLITLGAGFRVGTAYAPRPITDPAWYHSRAAFYCFNFVIEIIVVYAYALLRVDRRFHVPDGSSARHNYRPEEAKAETRIVSEEEFLDDFRPMEEVTAGEKADEESGNAGVGSGAAGGATRESATWEKRAESELQDGMREPPPARVT